MINQYIYMYMYINRIQYMYSTVVVVVFCIIILCFRINHINFGLIEARLNSNRSIHRGVFGTPIELLLLVAGC